MPDTFLSCSADGTVRYFDCRKNYQNTYSHNLGDDIKHEPVIPQVFFYNIFVDLIYLIFIFFI